MSDKSNKTVLPEQFDRTRTEENSGNEKYSKYDSINSELNPYETRPDALENYDYEGESGDGYGEGEEGFEVDGFKNKKFQRLRYIVEEDAWTDNLLTADEAGKCLKRIGKVGCGLLYAYIEIDVDHRNLTNIEEIVKFRHVSLINVSHNHLDLIALDVLRDLEYVIVLRADHNHVDSLCLSSMAYLQVLTLNSNRVSSLSGLKQPSLECLELNDNKISRLIRDPNKNFDGNYCSEIDCPNLSTLALSRNALETIEQFMFVSVQLRVLYLSYNKIDKLKGLEHLPNLSRLHLRANRISSLDGFTDNLKHLSYLNLRENRLHDAGELIKLACLKSLKTLVVSQNDFGRNRREITSKVLKLLPWLERIDKQTVSAKGFRVHSSGSESGQEYEGPYEEE